MNHILKEVFLYDDVRGGQAVGFQSYGLGDVGDRVGYIVKHESLGHVLSATEGMHTPHLTPSHLRTIADHLRHLNEQA